jgi:hypothetical protein
MGPIGPSRRGLATNLAAGSAVPPRASPLGDLRVQARPDLDQAAKTGRESRSCLKSRGRAAELMTEELIDFVLLNRL